MAQTNCGGGPLRQRLSAHNMIALSVSLRSLDAAPGHVTFWTRNLAAVAGL
jgi:hypothetical protein